MTPREIATDELAEVRDTYVQAARRAVEAGADGVELHAANGYLLHQFLSSNTNLRTDGYGDDVAGRIRFVVETVDAVADAIGERRVSIRLSPGHEFNGIEEADPEATYDALLRALAPRDLMYVHVMETEPFTGYSSLEQARRLYPGTLMANAGFTEEFDVEGADDLVRDGRIDLVAYGRRFLANPDLPRRLAEGAPLNEPVRETSTAAAPGLHGLPGAGRGREGPGVALRGARRGRGAANCPPRADGAECEVRGLWFTQG